MTPMRVPLYRAEQIAAHLREQIRRGELNEPLPGTRAWSQKLGVSRPTLDKALHLLEQQGVLSIYPRGARLALRQDNLRRETPLVRVLYYGLEYPELEFDWVVPLSERFHHDGIQLALERCTVMRLRAFAEQKSPRNELFLLASLPLRYQKLFAQHRKPAIMIGEPGKGVSLPFVTVDLPGAVTHAVHTLLHADLSRLLLVMPKASSPGLERTAKAFKEACARWPHQPVYRRVVPMPMNPQHLENAARRVAILETGKFGMIVVAPVPVGMLMTALLQRGVTVPGQAKLIAVFPSSNSLKVSPRPTHYPFPLRRFVNTLGEAAAYFFETDTLPTIRRTLNSEIAPAGK